MHVWVKFVVWLCDICASINSMGSIFTSNLVIFPFVQFSFFNEIIKFVRGILRTSSIKTQRFVPQVPITNDLFVYSKLRKRTALCLAFECLSHPTSRLQLTADIDWPLVVEVMGQQCSRCHIVQHVEHFYQGGVISCPRFCLPKDKVMWRTAQKGTRCSFWPCRWCWQSGWWSRCSHHRPSRCEHCPSCAWPARLDCRTLSNMGMWQQRQVITSVTHGMMPFGAVLLTLHCWQTKCPRLFFIWYEPETPPWRWYGSVIRE